jgi:integrase
MAERKLPRNIYAYESAKGTRYRIKYRNAENHQRTRRGFKTLREAQSALSRARIAVEDGRHVEVVNAKIKIAELGEPWIVAKRASLKPSAFRSLESAWRIHVKPKWGERQVASLKPVEIRDWLAALQAKRSATTVLRVHGVLAGILDDAVADRRILANPSRDKRTVTKSLPKKKPGEHIYLTHEQVDLLARESRYPVVVSFLAYTGLRWGEATGLRVKDLDVQRRRVYVDNNAVMVGSTIIEGSPKDNESRSVPYPAFLAPALNEQAKDKTARQLLLGDGRHHLPLPHSKYGWFARAVARIRESDSAFPEVTPHDMRHTAASLAVSAGANVKAVQRMLGHASAAMTLDVYADLFDDDLDTVANALDRARTRSLGARISGKKPHGARGRR